MRPPHIAHIKTHLGGGTALTDKNELIEVNTHLENSFISDGKSRGFAPIDLKPQRTQSPQPRRFIPHIQTSKSWRIFSEYIQARYLAVCQPINEDYELLYVATLTTVEQVRITPEGSVEITTICDVNDFIPSGTPAIDSIATINNDVWIGVSTQTRYAYAYSWNGTSWTEEFQKYTPAYYHHVYKIAWFSTLSTVALGMSRGSPVPPGGGVEMFIQTESGWDTEFTGEQYAYLVRDIIEWNDEIFIIVYVTSLTPGYYPRRLYRRTGSQTWTVELETEYPYTTLGSLGPFGEFNNELFVCISREGLTDAPKQGHIYKRTISGTWEDTYTTELHAFLRHNGLLEYQEYLWAFGVDYVPEYRADILKNIPDDGGERTFYKTITDLLPTGTMQDVVMFNQPRTLILSAGGRLWWYRPTYDV